jgi:ketosteroid isomerase-like protein
VQTPREHSETGPKDRVRGSDSKVEVVRAFYEAGDLPAMLERLDPRIEWRVPVSLPWGGIFRGHEGFRRFSAIVTAQLAEARREKLLYLDAGDRIVVLLHSVGRPKGGSQFDEPEVHVCAVQNGKIISADIYVDSAMVLRSFHEGMGTRGTGPAESDVAESDVEVVRAFYEAAARRDVDAILELLDPEVVLRAPESLPWGGTFHGHEGVQEFFGKLAEEPVENRREVREYLDAGDRIIVQLRLFGRAKGGVTETEVPEIHVWTVRNGKIVDLEAIFDTATALRAWLSQP